MQVYLTMEIILYKCTFLKLIYINFLIQFLKYNIYFAFLYGCKAY